jgi:hypothetical protein
LILLEFANDIDICYRRFPLEIFPNALDSFDCDIGQRSNLDQGRAVVPSTSYYTAPGWARVIIFLNWFASFINFAEKQVNTKSRIATGLLYVAASTSVG